MADVSVYKQATTTYFWSNQTINAGEVRLATDPAVTANPQWWATVTDAEMSAGTVQIDAEGGEA